MRLLITGLFLLPLLLQAQIQVGWRTDTYAGINSATLNPALPGRTPYNWDVNLGEASFFLANNYVYLENTSILKLLRNRNADWEVFFREDLPSDLSPDSETLVYDFHRKNAYYGEQLVQVMGPSFSVQVAPQTRVGIFTRWQAMGQGGPLDEDLGYYQWNALPNLQGFTLDESRLAMAAWGELGLNISQGIETSSGSLLIGASVRRLWGQRAAYFASREDFTLIKLPANEGLEGIDFEIEAGFTQNVTNTDDYTDSPGKGWGVDLGMLYRLDLGDGFYRWEFGLSLLDFGGIRFTESEQHIFNSDVLATTLTNGYDNLDADNGLSEAAQQLSEDVFGGNNTSRVGDEFTLGLPTSLSLQAAYSFQEWAKVEAVYITGIRVGSASLNRNSVLAVVPRIDRHWWSFALPISYYATDQFRLGMSARLGPLFVGTDQLGSFFRKDQLDSGDFYVGLKLFPFGFGNNRSSKKRKNKGRRGKGKDVECYKF